MACKLKKELYGLKQPPRAWYARLDRYLTQQGFNKDSIDNNLYFKVEGNKILIVVVYVDDIIFRGNEGMCKRFAEEMQKEFEVSMIGELNFFLGLQVNQTDKGISIYNKSMSKSC